MDGFAARNGGRTGLALLVAILLLGLGLRVDNAWQGRAPVYDAAAYATIAANLERGEGFTLGPGATQPASNYSPGLPLFAGGLYAVTGGIHERTARLVLALIGSLSVLFAYLIGRRLAGPLAGLVGAAAVAVYPALLEYQGMLMSEPLAASLLSGSVLSMLWASAREEERGPSGDRWVFRLRRGWPSEGVGGAKNRTPRPPEGPLSSSVGWLVPGLLLGALALVRPEYLAISLPIAVVVFARRGRDDWRAGLVQALVMLVGLALVVAPWAVRNEVALGRCCLPAATCPRAAIPNGLGPRYWSGIPNCAGSCRRVRGLSRYSLRWRGSGTQSLKAMPRWRGWAVNGSGKTSASIPRNTPISSPQSCG
jgi:4-amino-4-deoxy-L-arabinose transferase-like glycosyltransferase